MGMQQGLMFRCRLAAVLLGLSAALSGCWTTTVHVQDIERRRWSETVIADQGVLGKVDATVSAQDGRWRLDVRGDTADLCQEELHRTVAQVQSTERRTNGRTVGIPLLAGIITAIAVPVGAFYVSSQAGAVRAASPRGRADRGAAVGARRDAAPETSPGTDAPNSRLVGQRQYHGTGLTRRKPQSEQATSGPQLPREAIRIHLGSSNLLPPRRTRNEPDQFEGSVPPGSLAA